MSRRFLAATSSIVLVALTGCGGDQKAAPPNPAYVDPGIVHAHGLGVDPADGALFIATHTGLFRAPKGQDKAKRVGESFQDTMGFTVSGPGRFLGSGHPDARSKQPPMSSGRKPTKLSKPRGTVIDLVISPRDVRRYVAATDSGLYVSRDAGRRWTRLDRRRTGLLAYLKPGALTLVRGDGVVERLTPHDGWRQVGQVQGRPGALASQENTLYLAVQGGPVLESSDGGSTWAQRIAAGG